MKKIDLTEEESKDFYSQVAKEDVCRETLQTIIKEMKDAEYNKNLKECLKEAQLNYNDVLTESSLLLLHLQKKYNVKKVFVENGCLIVEEE